MDDIGAGGEAGDYELNAPACVDKCIKTDTGM